MYKLSLVLLPLWKHLLVTVAEWISSLVLCHLIAQAVINHLIRHIIKRGHLLSLGFLCPAHLWDIGADWWFCGSHLRIFISSEVSTSVYKLFILLDTKVNNFTCSKRVFHRRLPLHKPQIDHILSETEDLISLVCNVIFVWCYRMELKGR